MHPMPPESRLIGYPEPGTAHVLLHTVEQGDTLETVSSRYYGHHGGAVRIGAANGHTAHNLIPGTTIRVPQ